MSDRIIEKARELGAMLGQTAEYGAVGRARKRIEEDETLRPLLTAMDSLERELTEMLQRGEQPDDAFRARYEESFGALQGHSSYQAMIAAQANFDRIVARVNDAIGQGMDEGAGSRIIIPRS
ncbi:MAG TPA: YlbF family regulator [Longimicrobiales bacterium]|nr:YlbF family regulator [Longimicrobiales bacterium]